MVNLGQTEKTCRVLVYSFILKATFILKKDINIFEISIVNIVVERENMKVIGGY